MFKGFLFFASGIVAGAVTPECCFRAHYYNSRSHVVSFRVAMIISCPCFLCVSVCRKNSRHCISSQGEVGNRWADIAKRLTGRTENAVKIRWKALNRRQRDARNKAAAAAAASGPTPGLTSGQQTIPDSPRTGAREGTRAAARAAARAVVGVSAGDPGLLADTGEDVGVMGDSGEEHSPHDGDAVLLAEARPPFSGVASTVHPTTGEMTASAAVHATPPVPTVPAAPKVVSDMGNASTGKHPQQVAVATAAASAAADAAADAAAADAYAGAASAAAVAAAARDARKVAPRSMSAFPKWESGCNGMRPTESASQLVATAAATAAAVDEAVKAAVPQRRHSPYTLGAGSIDAEDGGLHRLCAALRNVEAMDNLQESQDDATANAAAAAAAERFRRRTAGRYDLPSPFYASSNHEGSSARAAMWAGNEPMEDLPRATRTSGGSRDGGVPRLKHSPSPPPPPTPTPPPSSLRSLPTAIEINFTHPAATSATMGGPPITTPSSSSAPTPLIKRTHPSAYNGGHARVKNPHQPAKSSAFTQPSAPVPAVTVGTEQQDTRVGHSHPETFGQVNPPGSIPPGNGPAVLAAAAAVASATDADRAMVMQAAAVELLTQVGQAGNREERPPTRRVDMATTGTGAPTAGPHFGASYSKRSPRQHTMRGDRSGLAPSNGCAGSMASAFVEEEAANVIMGGKHGRGGGRTAVEAIALQPPAKKGRTPSPPLASATPAL